MTATYVYALAPADVELPSDLHGLGTGTVQAVTHGELAALVGEVPTDKPLGTRDDVMAHEQVVDTVAAGATVLPMRFGAVLTSPEAVVEELLAPNHDQFVSLLTELEGRVQYTVRGRYDQDAVLPEVVAGNPEIKQLRESIQGKSEDASYYERIRLGELVVAELQARRESDAAVVHERLVPLAVAAAVHDPGAPDDVLNTGFLVEREKSQEFEKAVEDLSAELTDKIELRMLGPLAPYDFVTQE
jgi:Gas vesicle synthesis protein GvpL/GvpF